jgi:hypothetical protein
VRGSPGIRHDYPLPWGSVAPTDGLQRALEQSADSESYTVLLNSTKFNLSLCRPTMLLPSRPLPCLRGLGGRCCHVKHKMFLTISASC